MRILLIIVTILILGFFDIKTFNVAVRDAQTELPLDLTFVKEMRALINQAKSIAYYEWSIKSEIRGRSDTEIQVMTKRKNALGNDRSFSFVEQNIPEEKRREVLKNTLRFF